MVLCYEEKDRTAIEAVGIKIIEFKRLVYKTCGIWEKIREVICIIWDVVKNVIRKAFTQIKEALRTIRVHDIQKLEPRKRWKYVRSLERIGIPVVPVYFYRSSVFHCRNNC